MGASLAGVASVMAVQNSRSYVACGLGPWPEDARSILVIGLSHPANRPELDWGEGREGTQGNRILIQIANDLIDWLDREQGIAARDIPYRLEKGGIFLKDAAVHAGLGVFGKNNLIVTPAFGPRIRFRALFLDRTLTPSRPLDYSPCAACEAPCLTVCPQKAFSDKTYDRSACMKQMDADAARAKPRPGPVPNEPKPGWILYCRLCELACPVGWASAA